MRTIAKWLDFRLTARTPVVGLAGLQIGGKRLLLCDSRIHWELLFLAHMRTFSLQLIDDAAERAPRSPDSSYDETIGAT